MATLYLLKSKRRNERYKSSSNRLANVRIEPDGFRPRMRIKQPDRFDFKPGTHAQTCPADGAACGRVYEERNAPQTALCSRASGLSAPLRAPLADAVTVISTISAAGSLTSAPRYGSNGSISTKVENSSVNSPMVTIEPDTSRLEGVIFAR
ncbi:hypothetical protein EVAR_89312_1 [Eumeta japonica]|uniref:Uncharacterized protein n=1 Tax=Eumeta variegata TaxID=151549 RepID=A0A4C1Z2B4_EUMVA|nr:hypothetical protein EVAR_89312_1 [Eumeta japonica]